jgi:asparagine synthase (glutamine-hydrolysing)
VCGIAGYWDFAAAKQSFELIQTGQRMAGALRHRGPDDGGVWVDQRAGIVLGHRRLAVVDLSDTGHQPMISSSGRYTLVFNGEIYNFRELRSRLLSGGGSAMRFRGTSDSEVMLACFEEWGLEKALESFEGMFAFALWDGVERRLHLACDRAGEKPVYFARRPGAFLFGSELKALHASGKFALEVDIDSLCAYFRYGYVPHPRTIYKAVNKLSPGCFITTTAVDRSSPAERPYWTANDVACNGKSCSFSGTTSEAIDELERVLQDSIKSRMLADVPIGAFLSGGVDSSTVLALMQKISSRPVRSITIGFDNPSYDEAPFAARVARHLGTDHTTVYINSGEAMDVIPHLPHIYDEPFADSSQIPMYLVSRVARQNVTVSLSGDGGDELFAGYTRHRWIPAVFSRLKRTPSILRTLVSNSLLVFTPQDWDRLFERIGPALPHFMREGKSGDKIQKLAKMIAAPGAEEMYRTVRSFWDAPAKLVLDSLEPESQSVSSCCAELRDPTDKLLLLDLMTYLPDDILVKVDRAAMAVSLETRLPLLARQVIEFAWRLPTSLKIRHGHTKWILRQVLYRYVPKELIERPKSGFAIPLHEWLRGPLREWAEDTLSEARLRRDGYLNPGLVRAAWEEHLSGKRNRMDSLWTVLVFNSWLEAAKRPAPFSAQDDNAFAECSARL